MLGAGSGERSDMVNQNQEATLVLARLVQRFDMQLAPGAKVWPLQKITLRPAYGLPIRIVPRPNA
jgi:cytochrome P450